MKNRLRALSLRALSLRTLSLRAVSLRTVGSLCAALALALQMSFSTFAIGGLTPGVPEEIPVPAVTQSAKTPKTAPAVTTAPAASAPAPAAASTSAKAPIEVPYTLSKLAGADKTNYEALLKGIRNMEPSITLPVAMPLDKFSLLTDALLAEELDIQYVGNKMSYNGDPVQRVTFTYSLNKNQADERMKTLMAKADKIVASLPPNATDFQKVVFFHDYIISNTTYTLNGPRHDIASAYGALVNGKALCHGYAQAMALLCSRVGIENCYSTGKIDVPHIWNKVKLAGQWYNVDATTDDPDMQTDFAGNLVLYEDCLVTDKEILQGRTPFQAYVTPPTANSNSQNYFVQTNQYAADERAFRQILANGIYRMLTTSDSTAELKCASEALAQESYKKYTTDTNLSDLFTLVTTQYKLERQTVEVGLKLVDSTVYVVKR